MRDKRAPLRTSEMEDTASRDTPARVQLHLSARVRGLEDGIDELEGQLAVTLAAGGP